VVTVFDEMFPILTTPDLERSLRFYRDLLGASVDYQFPPSGEPVYVGLELGRSHLGIGRQDEPGDLANDRVTLWIYTDDCDAGLDRLRTAGIEILQEPVDQPWGERMATVADPDGNRIIIASRAPSA
jgi:lactoylglutathione lyase